MYTTNFQIINTVRTYKVKHTLFSGCFLVVKVYGEEAYICSEYFIDVVIPFNREGFGKTTRKTTTTQPENIEDEIIQLIKNNGNISRKDIAIVLHKTEGSIRHYLKKLQE